MYDGVDENTLRKKSFERVARVRLLIKQKHKAIDQEFTALNLNLMYLRMTEFQI